MKKHLAVFALTMLVIGTVASTSTTKVFADWLIDRSGTLVQVDGTVLGDDDESPDSHNETETEDANDDHATEVSNQESSKAEELRTEAAIKSAELRRETSKTKAEQAREQAKQRLEKEIKARTLQKPRQDNVKFEVKTAGTGTEVNLHVNQTETSDDGKTKLQRKLDVKPGESLFVEREGEHPVEIKAVNPGEIEISRDQVKTHTNLPITVNANNELILTKPNGETKTLTVLPDQVRSKLLEHGVIADTLADSSELDLTENESGEPIYKVEGQATKKVLGLFRMSFAAESEVNAQTGDTISTSKETAPLRRLLELLSR